MNGYIIGSKLKYSIVVVTCNRLDKVKECLSCIDKLTIEPQYIVVVDNHSNDGTVEYLKKYKNDHNNAELLLMSENTGGAGGFYYGIERAYDLKSDWIIVIDDDAMLEENYVMAIYEHIQSESNVELAYCGSVYEAGEIALKHRRNLQRGIICRERNIPEDEYKKIAFECDQATFCGLMINRKVVEQTGLPIKEFFIWYDDTEYSMRIRKLGKIVVVPKAMINHKCAVVKDNMSYKNVYAYSIKEYYGIRNRIITASMHYSYMTVLAMRWMVRVRILRQKLIGICLLISAKPSSEYGSQLQNIKLNCKIMRSALDDAKARRLGVWNQE